MADDCTVVRFSRDPSLARIENVKAEIDRSESHNFGVFYVICIGLSIATYLADLTLACILLYCYSLNGYGLYFGLTLTFVILPALCMTAFSLRWYIVDHDDASLGKTSLVHWIVRIIFLLLQLSPLLRYLETLVFGIRSKIASKVDNENHQGLYRRMLDEDTNAALLRLFHCFLHAAPQAVIQLMILLRQAIQVDETPISINVGVLQVWTVMTALMSIAWSLTSYHRSVRYARDDKDKVKWLGTLVAFCWQLMSALSRVLALSLLASIFPIWMGCVCAIHWGVMFIWLVLGQHQSAACGSKCDELLLSTALGLAYVLAFISPRDGPTRYVYLMYYLVCFMENTGALVVWCVTNKSGDNQFLYYGAASAQLLAFALAITFLIIYYKFCHPSMRIRTKIPSMDSDILECDKASFSKSFNVRSRS